MYYKVIDFKLIGKVILLADEKGLISITHQNQKEFNSIISSCESNNDYPIFTVIEQELDKYLNQKEFNFDLIEQNISGTNFQKCVWQELIEIPHGKTTTYKDISDKVAKRMNKDKMSARAVGTAIGKNPLLIIIPCHRVIGTDNKLRGFAAGLDVKKKLLDLEGSNYIE